MQALAPHTSPQAGQQGQALLWLPDGPLLSCSLLAILPPTALSFLFSCLSRAAAFITSANIAARASSPPFVMV